MTNSTSLPFNYGGRRYEREDMDQARDYERDDMDHERRRSRRSRGGIKHVRRLTTERRYRGGRDARKSRGGKSRRHRRTIHDRR